jgi:hypothetical protein
MWWAGSAYHGGPFIASERQLKTALEKGEAEETSEEKTYSAASI